MSLHAVLPFERPAEDLPEESPTLRDIRRRWAREGDLFRTAGGQLCIMNPLLAARFNTENFQDHTLSDRLVDVVRGQSSARASWRDLRGLWLAQLARPELHVGFARRLERHVEERLGRPIDLAWELQIIVSDTLVETIADGLGGWGAWAVRRDQRMKIDRLLGRPLAGPHFWKTWRSIEVQTLAGLAMRRELRARSTGKAPRRIDLIDPLIDRLDALGPDRAVDSAMAVLTAVAGPPGSSAACLLHEWIRRPEWRRRLAPELAAADPLRLISQPGREAPQTHRFVREVLRLRSLPVLMRRPVLRQVQVGDRQLSIGDEVLLSPYLIHRDRRSWPDAERFAPDRWLPPEQGGHGEPSPHTYVPFGWAPRACIGAGLGIAQAMLLCRLFTTRFRFTLETSATPTVRVATVPEVHGLRGVLEHRSSSG